MEHDQRKPILEAARRGQHHEPPGMHGDDDDGIALGEIIAVVMHHKWLIAGITALALLAGLAYTALSKPVYRADGLLQVEEQSTGLSSLKELQPLLADETSVAAELEILGSRMVLGRVVDKLKLDIVAAPKTFPVVGSAVGRRHEGNEPAAAWAGLEGYAWGGEAIQVDSLDVPRDYLDHPLRLVAREKGSFTLIDDDRQLLAGNVGTRAEKDGFSIFVARLEARPGTRFVVARRAPETAINELRARYSAKERGKKSGIIELSLQGPDKARIAAVLDEIQNTYVRQNVERPLRSAEAGKDPRLPGQPVAGPQGQVTAAETAYNSYRRGRGSLDLSLETQGVLKSLVEVEDAAIKLKQETGRAAPALLREHPSIQAIDAKLAASTQAATSSRPKSPKLPDTQQTVVRLARDVEVSTKALHRTAQHRPATPRLQGRHGGRVRIIDKCRRLPHPGWAPRLPPFSQFSVLLGLLASMVGHLGHSRPARGGGRPRKPSKRNWGSGLCPPPHSKAEVTLSRRARKAGGGSVARR